MIMKKLNLVLIGLAMAAVCCLAFVNRDIEAASPAVVEDGQGCVVKDANNVQYFDAACEYHFVYKLDENGDLEFVNYQDKGRLPAGAALPNRAYRTQSVVTCGGCILEGTYDEIITPSGNYSSRGPN